MNPKQFQSFLENEMIKNNSDKKIEKIQYTMEFGDMAIQYDFCLN